jgi:hypothetical protein
MPALEHVDLYREVRERDPLQGCDGLAFRGNLIQRRNIAGTVPRVRAYRRGENLKGDQYKWSKVEAYWRWALRSSSPSRRVPSPKVAAAVVLEVRAERELARHPAQAQAVEALATLVQSRTAGP